MLKLTYRELLTARPVIQQLANSRSVAPALMIRVYRLVRVGNGVLEDFDAARSQLVERHGEDNSEALQREVTELLDERVDLAAEPLPASLFLANGSVDISAADLYQLGPLFVDDGEADGSG